MAPIRLSLRKNFLAIGKFQSWHILHDINRTQLSRLFMWGFCAFLSAGLLLIATKSSPLYPLNDWPDANTFFSIGKGMMNGLVPYRDLFEQKGPLLYFFHGVASLISQRSFMGVYILEVLSFSVFLYFAQKSLSLFVPVQYSLFALPILAASVLNLRSFAHGDTAESYVFPFMMFSLYTLLRHFKEHEPEPMPPKVQLLNGVMAGCVMWIKYAFLGFWFGWLLTVVAAQIGKRNFHSAFKSSLIFLGGMLIATLPWLAYFGFTHALSDWFNTYFILNLTKYPESLTIPQVLRTALLSFRQHLTFNPLSVSLLAFGTVIILTTRGYIKSLILRVGLSLSLGMLLFGVYGGGKDYIYYFLIFAPFLLFGFIILAKLYAESYSKLPSKGMTLFLIFFITSVSFAYTIRFNRNVYMLDWRKEDMVQIKFAEIISQSPQPTLLNYGFQDSGFYTATGITPSVKYYQKYNFTYGEFPINMDEQNRYIAEKQTEYVVIRLNPDEKIKNLNLPYLDANYEMISRDKQMFGETEFTYLLYQRRD